jgi:hypothetical protein
MTNALQMMQLYPILLLSYACEELGVHAGNWYIIGKLVFRYRRASFASPELAEAFSASGSVLGLDLTKVIANRLLHAGNLGACSQCQREP